MKKRPVNLGRSDENIAEQYPNIYEGLQKDAGQNSWDARITKKGKDWRLLFKYIRERNCLMIEDSGTKGMDATKWNSYQSLWDTSKKETELGARGQGKFLFHYFSARKLVLTETIDESGKYRFSYGTSEEWDEDKCLADFLPDMKPLDHQGTRIWILDVKKEFLDELLDPSKFSRYIETTWWEIIRDYNASFVIDFDGCLRKVAISQPPSVSKVRQFRSEKVNGLGTIRNLELYYTADDVPEEIRGIAVQRGGMTITRIPVVADESLRNKIYGFTNFDEELETELKKCELPNHFGFFNRKAWNHVREYIRRKLETFVLEITPPRKKVEVSSSILNEAVRLLNSLVEQYAPELLIGPSAPGGKGGGGKDRTERPKPPVRIDTFRPNQKKFEYNETLITDCELVNATSQDREVTLEVRLSHEEGKDKHSSVYHVRLSAESRLRIDVPLIDFDPGDSPGRYFAEAVLSDTVSHDELHNRSFTIWLHQEPPTTGRSFVKGFKMIMGRKVQGKTLFFAKWRNLEINEEGIIHVVWDHPDFERVRVRAGKKARNQEILVYITERGVDEALRRLLANRLAEERLDTEEIKKTKILCEEMIYDAVVRTGV